MSIASTGNSSQPVALQQSLQGIQFVCPLCRGPLENRSSEDGYDCRPCGKQYPLHAGIPDFRLFPDPFLSFQEDEQRTDIMLEELHRRNFIELLEYYWSFSTITPPELRHKFIRSALLGEARARRVLSSFEDGTFHQPVSARRVLEVGSGTGNFLALAAGRYDLLVGIDIGMRHLHVSRRRFMDKCVPVPSMVCCCAEYLPFPDGYFDLIVTSSTLEFTRDQSKVLGECARTLRNGGALYVQTVNRYALGRDPYAYLWGVGFLPRRYQAKYVRWRRQSSYENVRTLSIRELSLLTSQHFPYREIVLPHVASAALPHFSPPVRLQIHVYELVRSLPWLRTVLKAVGPSWEVLLQKR